MCSCVFNKLVVHARILSTILSVYQLQEIHSDTSEHVARILFIESNPPQQSHTHTYTHVIYILIKRKTHTCREHRQLSVTSTELGSLTTKARSQTTQHKGHLHHIHLLITHLRSFLLFSSFPHYFFIFYAHTCFLIFADF